MRRVFVIIALLSLTIPAYTPAYAAERPSTAPAIQGEVKGTYTLILYGGRFLGDVETVAILDLEGDGYEFKPNAPDFDYRVIKGLKAEDALHEAEAFVRDHRAFWRSELNSIKDSNGKVLGYEVVPLYYSFMFGIPDAIDVSYAVKGDKVTATVWLRPEVERILRDGDGIFFRRRF